MFEDMLRHESVFFGLKGPWFISFSWRRCILFFKRGVFGHLDIYMISALEGFNITLALAHDSNKFYQYFLIRTQHPSPLDTTSVSTCFSCPTGQSSHPRPSTASMVSNTRKTLVIVYFTSNNSNSCPRHTLGPPLNGKYPHPPILVRRVGSSHRSGRKVSASGP